MARPVCPAEILAQRRFSVIRTSSKLPQRGKIFDPNCHTHGTLARYFMREVLIDKS
jgi:hypothetical protein